MNLNWKRRLIPKWRISSDKPIVFGEDKRAVPSTDFLLDEDSQLVLESALSDFQNAPSVGLAADALRFAIEHKYTEKLRPAAEFLLKSSTHQLPHGIYQVAQQIKAGSRAHRARNSEALEPENFEAFQSIQNQQIRELRQSVRAYPHNALAWMDLARLKTSIGDNESAKRHATVAYKLAPNSRFIIRSSARFYAHIDEPERALKLIQSSPRTQKDPWLMASEIALSSINGRSSRMIRKAHELLESRRFTAADTAELAGALAVEELGKGSSKKFVRSLYLKALVAPNDNVLAQVQWAADDIGLVNDIPPQWIQAPASAEAALYRAMLNGDIEMGLKKALRWHFDEPFASRPMTVASFLATLNADFQAASRFAQRGLIGEPENENLLNNLVFSLLCEGNIDQAAEVISKVIRLQGTTRDPHTIANIGFLAYLSDESEIGTRAYSEAIKILERTGRGDEVVMAHIFHAFATKQLSEQKYELLRKRALDLVKNSKNALVKKTAEIMLGTGLNDAGLSPKKSGAALPKNEPQHQKIWGVKNILD